MSSNLVLKRIAENEHGTFGVLLRDSSPLCLTLERPWNDNKEDSSCIPLGTYLCIPHSGEKFQNVWEVTDVPNRESILIHAGNSIDDTHGCILVGGLFMPYGVGLSKVALEDLRKKLPANFSLTITGV